MINSYWYATVQKQHVDIFIIILSSSLQSDTKPLNRSGVFFFVYVIIKFKLVHAASTILYSCVTRKKSWFVYNYTSYQIDILLF